MGFLSTSTTLTSLNTPGTPQSALNTPSTPQSAFNTPGTPYSALNTSGTHHSAFNTPGTPYSALNTPGTQHSVFNTPGTPYSDTPTYTFNTPFCTSGPCSSYSTGQPHVIDPATPGVYDSPEFKDNNPKKSIHPSSRFCTPGPYFTSPNFPTDKSYPKRSNQTASKYSDNSAVSTSYPEYSQGSNVISSTGSYSTSVEKSRLPEYSRESHSLYSLAGVHKYKQGK